MLDRSTSPGAARARKSRALRRVGCKVLHVAANEKRLVKALRKAGRLPEDETREPPRKDIEAEAAQVVADFITRWIGPEKKPCA